ncbi:MAG: hypothetical protein LVQ95_01510 [Candidatus Micrarchaeales archaeon]|nr:hypothetical protein [Candidatus Micrarchaeales archaeon]
MAKTKIITISVNEESEGKFRRLAILKYGKRKGALGKALTEAIDDWVRELQEADLTEKTLKLLKRGVAIKRKWKFNREELYDERFRHVG